MAKAGKTGPQRLPFRPSAASRQARPFSRWTLALCAFLIAFFIWMIAKREEVDSDVIQVPARLLDVPDYIEARFQPQEVSVALQFPRALKSEIVPENFVASIDFGELLDLGGAPGAEFPGSLEFRARSVPMDSSRFGLERDSNVSLSQIHVERFRPPDIRVEARHRGKVLPVRPMFEGVPASDYRLNANRSQAKPSEVFVAGTPEDLMGVVEVRTMPVSVAGRRASFSQAQARLNLPGGLSAPLWNRNVVVEIAAVIEPVVAERLVEGAPFHAPIIAKNVAMRTDPETIGVRVRGPKNLLDQLGPDSFDFFLERNVDETPGASYEDVPFGVKVRRAVPRAQEGVYEVLGAEPSRIDLHFVASEPAEAPR
jgi:hypothetical protein